MFAQAGVGILGLAGCCDFDMVVDFDHARHLGDARLGELLEVIAGNASPQRENAAREVARDVAQLAIGGAQSTVWAISAISWNSAAKGLGRASAAMAC